MDTRRPTRRAPGRGHLGPRQLRRPRRTSSARSTRSGPSSSAADARSPSPRRPPRRRPATDAVSGRRYSRRMPFDLVTDLSRPATSPRRSGPGRGIGAATVPDAARHHRVGQDVHDRQRDRQSDRPRSCSRPTRRSAAQLQRSSVSSSRATRGVLRLLLRLLPTRGLHPVVRHLHREGQLDQRRDRPAAPLGHERAPHPARRDHRRVGLGDLRARLARAVRQAAADVERRGASTSAASCAGSWSCSTSATTSRSPATSSACGATPSRCSPPTRSGGAHPALRRRGGAHLARSTRSPARWSKSWRGSCCSRRRTT